MQGYALASLLFKFVLECAIRIVQETQTQQKLIETHQFMPYANDVNLV
jgi:hypothetical protein